MADASNDESNEQPAGKSDTVKSPILMKIDAPDCEKSSEEENKPDSFSSSSSSNSFAKPAFGNSFGYSFSNSGSSHRPFGIGVPSSSPVSFSGIRSSSSSFGSMSSYGFNKPCSTTSNSFSGSSKPLLLRPSQLAVGNVESTSTSGETSEERTVTTSGSNEADTSNTSENSTSKLEKETNQEKNEPSSSQNNVTNSQGGSPKFVPLGATPQQKDDSSTVGGSAVSSSVTGFVFGQNLHARVAEAVAVQTADSTSGKNDGASTSKAATSNGTSASEMLFTSVIQRDTTTNSVSADSGCPDTPSKSLSEAAREYEESRAVKRKYDEVAVFTGEEDEANVVQLNCKLFAFDKTNGQWVERGRGTLRLNDKDGSGGVQSRVIMRTSGSLRVILNTKIWSGMTVERPSPKSVRLTAMDPSGQIKVFLVMASPKEIEAFHKSLQSRVTRQQQSEAKNDMLDQPTAFSSKRQSLDVQDAGGGYKSA